MKKTLLDYKNLSRWPIANHGRSVMSKVRRLNRLPMFEPREVWEWITSYLRYAFFPRHKFLGASAAPNQTSCYTVPDRLRISVVGDWGTGTEEAELVASQMMEWKDHVPPDLTIHLGDVYYVGDEQEVMENCLGVGKGRISGVKWPTGRLGSFALNGNHEMYANGNAYFDTFLPRLGMKDHAGDPAHQGPSFFNLENACWRILGIDTAYNSVGFPILSHWLEANCKLRDELIAWLRDTVKPRENPKATVVLSHHQYFSGFEKGYPLPAQQLAEFFESPIIWLWGHEHRLAGYQYFGSESLKVYGRCIGHGGMPIDAKKLDEENPVAKHVLFYDARVNPLYEADNLGYNGFIQLRLDDNTLAMDYLSLSAKNPAPGNRYAAAPMPLLTETFQCDGVRITHTSFERLCQDPNFVVLMPTPHGADEQIEPRA